MSGLGYSKREFQTLPRPLLLMWELVFSEKHRMTSSFRLARYENIIEESISWWISHLYAGAERLNPIEIYYILIDLMHFSILKFEFFSEAVVDIVAHDRYIQFKFNIEFLRSMYSWIGYTLRLLFSR